MAHPTNIKLPQFHLKVALHLTELHLMVRWLKSSLAHSIPIYDPSRRKAIYCKFTRCVIKPNSPSRQTPSAAGPLSRVKTESQICIEHIECVCSRDAGLSHAMILDDLPGHRVAHNWKWRRHIKIKLKIRAIKIATSKSITPSRSRTISRT